MTTLILVMLVLVLLKLIRLTFKVFFSRLLCTLIDTAVHICVEHRSENSPLQSLVPLWQKKLKETNSGFRVDQGVKLRMVEGMMFVVSGSFADRIKGVSKEGLDNLSQWTLLSRHSICIRANQQWKNIHHARITSWARCHLVGSWWCLPEYPGGQ